MTVHAPLTMSKEAFLAFVERREERYEYAGGRVMMMAHVTKRHALVAKNLVVALENRLPAGRYDVVSESFAVHVGDSIRYPDILVEPVQDDRGALQANAPLLIAEVLSPGTLHTDFGDKKHEYLSLPTLNVYLIVSPDEPRLWIWRRTDGSFPAEPEIVEGDEHGLALPSLDIILPVADIYRGVR